VSRLGPGIRGGIGFVLRGLLVGVMLGAPAARAETRATEPLAEVDGQAITAEDLERAVGPRLRKLEEQIYDLKRKQLDALIAEQLLAREAAKRGTSVAVLLDAEVTAKVGLVSRSAPTCSSRSSPRCDSTNRTRCSDRAGSRGLLSGEQGAPPRGGSRPA